MFLPLLPATADATSSALLGINYAASATTVGNGRASAARTRQAAYASATLVALPPGERAAAALAAAAAVALAAAAAALAANAAAAGCCRGCRSCGDSTGMASSTCSLRERGALAPCRVHVEGQPEPTPPRFGRTWDGPEGLQFRAGHWQE
uniref:Uncharacterized protein n=1 Tax=Oryza sativa subsp. japonica TaxID=39947 RepID=Q94I02_ORYSJ|nr:Hypothetical protein [Oryza sativa Japonica Group]